MRALLPLSLALLLLGSCAGSRQASEPGLDPLSTCLAIADSTAAQLPAYLVPPPAGSTPRQRRQWQRAQATNLARAGVLPTTVKIKHSAVATAPGAVALTKPRASVAAGEGAVASTVGKAKAPVATGHGAHAEQVQPPRSFPWWVLAVVAALLGLNRLVRGRWLL
ncbi:hypothetical protein Q5H93_14720 [Hymenobacter sp. ASUV-10]|uniref:Uncharacterized protein n=1 Tax=Hymenobacter aranciens TaxID=3063996 RepID=A0ABT9BE70_9BACT|nr:hypothetical protein [Hymenobacter sp. ASUV-10]MDO7875994.1 hypothetical protein [Hymenobacter sp. ASUV-10]